VTLYLVISVDKPKQLEPKLERLDYSHNDEIHFGERAAMVGPTIAMRNRYEPTTDGSHTDQLKYN